MSNSEHLLPIFLLMLAFVFKLFIHQKVTPVLFIFLLLEFPVDIAFLANSFITAFIIKTGSKDGLVYFVGFLIATALIVFFWRQSRRWYETDHFIRCTIMTFFGYLACITGLVWSTSLLISAIGATS